MSRFSTLAITSALLGSAALMPTTADAALYKFFSGTTGYTGAYNGAGTVYDALDTLAITCPTSNLTCSGGSDERGNPLTFADFTATANTGLDGVNEDLRPAFGGMGVNNDGDDQIDPGNILTLTFSAANQFITGVATLFASGHEPFDPFAGVPTEAQLVGRGATINGTFYSFASLNAGGLSIAGTGAQGNVFTFQAGGSAEAARKLTTMSAA